VITGAPINPAHLNRMPYSRNLLPIKLFSLWIKTLRDRILDGKIGDHST